MDKSRGGVRGGADQFKWDDVQQLSYKDREQYLGFSEKLGYLDKGGKWRKKDWWTSKEQQSADSKISREQMLQNERQMSKRRDDLIMKFKLGEKDPFLEGCTDVASILQKLKQTDSRPALTPFEMAQLTQKGNRSDNQIELDEAHKADLMEGLGHSKKAHIASGIFSGVDAPTDSKDLK